MFAPGPYWTHLTPSISVIIALFEQKLVSKITLTQIFYIYFIKKVIPIESKFRFVFIIEQVVRAAGILGGGVVWDHFAWRMGLLGELALV